MAEVYFNFMKFHPMFTLLSGGDGLTNEVRPTNEVTLAFNRFMTEPTRAEKARGVIVV